MIYRYFYPCWFVIISESLLPRGLTEAELAEAPADSTGAGRDAATWVSTPPLLTGTCPEHVLGWEPDSCDW
eukprot:CAMPEP_0173171608 /NCGR_PEP_ID=MMETSP1141-20130122/1855_1 /TAXON_ID=483371 /ORGANISM="non described non described, Strain CCMP2298" /LENGTH=70 /DNA_ID=CAMNT_0014093567 /DNA_START=5 /DNA_END=214 /DNA_ORIENTATION=-